MGEVTDLEEWRQRRAVLDAAACVKAMARCLGTVDGNGTVSPAADDAGEGDQPF